MHTAMVPALTSVSLAREHIISDNLLLGRERGIQRLRGRENFAQTRRALRHALLSALETLDRADLMRAGPACALLTLRAKLLEALVHIARVLAQNVGKTVPLRLLRRSDLERGSDVRETRFHALARFDGRTPLMHLTLRAGSGGTRLRRRLCEYVEIRRDIRGLGHRAGRRKNG
jgi:hypothetical protein